MSVFNHISVKWKIYAIAIVSLIGFGGYLAFNVVVSGNNSRLLKELQDVTYPVLEKSNTNRVRLDRVSELLNSAVLTGEQDYINSAKESAALIVKDFDEIARIHPRQADRINKIKTEFNVYFSQAEKIAMDMTTGSVDVNFVQEIVAKKEAALTQYKTSLDSLIDDAHNDFSGNIASADKNSTLLLRSGFLIWAINILILTVTVYTIARIILKNINDVSSSLLEISKGGGDFSRKINVTSNDEIGMLANSFNGLMDNLRQKTNDLMSMMHNMHQGLFTITENETIHKEYASYIETIFRTKNVSGVYFGDLLFANANLGADTLDQIKVAVSSLLGSDEMMFEFNSHLLIKQYEVTFENGDETETMILELDWDPIITDDTITKIMVTVRDVTELRRMQAAAEEQRRELQIVGQILKASIEKFDHFIKNALYLLDSNEEMINNSSKKDLKLISDLFVNMHTIKGNARTYNFSYINDPVHEAENIYDRLRKENDFPYDKMQLLEDIRKVRTSLLEYKNIRAEKLGFSGGEVAISDDQLLIQKCDYQALIDQITADIEKADVDVAKAIHYAHHLQKMYSESIESVLTEIVESLPSIAKQLEKPVPEMCVSGKGLQIFGENSVFLKNVFTHMLRNSMDHGIEDAESRVAAGKSAEGHIYVELTNADQLLVEVSDDGRGLNIERLREKAIAANYITEAEAQDYKKIADCLFQSGVSTAEKITAISGRGVGMDAVKKYLQQNGCDIDIVIPEGTPAGLSFVPFKLAIRLCPKVAFVE